MRLVVNNDVNIDKWKQLLSVSEFASPFQSYDFYNFYNSIPIYTADVFAILEKDEYTSLVVIAIQKEKGIKSFFSKRGIVYGGPLIKKGSTESINVLLNEIGKYYKGHLIYLEARNFFDYSMYSPIFESIKWRFIPYVNITINTEDRTMSELLSNMKYNRRREIKQSLDRQAYHKICETEEELNELYSILDDLYKSRVKLPLPELSFFKKLWRSRIGRVFVVIHDGKVIGGSFCVVLHNKSIYTMYYCGLRQYDKKIFPTHLAVYAALEYAINTNCKVLDFMGAGIKNVEYGVRNYKQEFGGELNEYGRYLKILNPFLFKIGTLGLKLLKVIKI